MRIHLPWSIQSYTYKMKLCIHSTPFHVCLFLHKFMLNNCICTGCFKKVVAWKYDFESRIERLDLNSKFYPQLQVPPLLFNFSF